MFAVAAVVVADLPNNVLPPVEAVFDVDENENELLGVAVVLPAAGVLLLPNEKLLFVVLVGVLVLAADEPKENDVLLAPVDGVAAPPPNENLLVEVPVLAGFLK